MEFFPMRNLLIATLALSSAGLATLASSAPAMARDYPWCVRSSTYDGAGDCMYQTYAQCQASASGRAASCYVNPRVAFGQPQPSSRYQGPSYQ